MLREPPDLTLAGSSACSAGPAPNRESTSDLRMNPSSSLRLLPLLALAVLTLFAGAGCSREKWHVEPYEYTWNGPEEGSDRGSILIDQRSGRTWVLMSDGDGYYWEPIPRRNTVTPPSDAASKPLALRR